MTNNEYQVKIDIICNIEFANYRNKYYLCKDNADDATDLYVMDKKPYFTYR